MRRIRKFKKPIAADALAAPAPSSGPRRIRYAVVGLGYIAQSAVLPGFAHAHGNCELAALVSDDPEKLKRLARKYRVPATYAYDRFEECLRSGIDAVYLALPNALHHSYATLAAAAGVHVLCEKPMALNEAQCQQMIEAAQAGGAKLMIAYRLHFEPANLRAIAMADAGRFGELRFFHSTFSMQVVDDDIRLRQELGGGPLYDLGIYCINAARYLFRSEPTEVFATASRSRDPRFAEVDEMITAQLRFPGERIAAFTCSFGAANTSRYELVGSKGRLVMDPAFESAEPLRQRVTIGSVTKEKAFAVRDQFAAELAYFADCIRDGRDPEPSGREGLADIRVIDAIHHSIASRMAIKITASSPPLARPDPDQASFLPAVGSKPSLIHAHPPSEDD